LIYVLPRIVGGRVSCWLASPLGSAVEDMSDEVSSFLRSVEQLKDRRLEEDEARSRELEEKILQEKRERQARRAGTFHLSAALFRPCPGLCLLQNLDVTENDLFSHRRKTADKHAVNVH